MEEAERQRSYEAFESYILTRCEGDALKMMLEALKTGMGIKERPQARFDDLLKLARRFNPKLTAQLELEKKLAGWLEKDADARGSQRR